MTSFKWSISLAYFAKINGNSMEFQAKAMVCKGNTNGFSMVFRWVNGVCKWKNNDFKWSENKWKTNGFSMDFILLRVVVNCKSYF